MKLRARSKDADQASLPDSSAYDERLATLLVSTRRVEPYRIDSARDAGTSGTLAEKLIRAGVLTDEELATTLAEHYGADEIDFRSTEPEPEAMALLRDVEARRLRALPIRVLEDAVIVAVVDPSPEHVDAVSAA